MSATIPSPSVPDSTLDYCLKFIAYCGEFESMTVIDRHRLCTFAHGDHENWHPGTRVTIRLANRKELVATVVSVNRNLDVVWLETEEPVCNEKPDTTLPGEKTSYFVIGHSGRQLLNDPRTISEGIISSARITEKGHILGSSGSSPGDIGSPVFRKSTGDLMGMVVGGENVQVRRLGDGSFVVDSPSRAFIVPISSLLLSGSS